LILFGIDILISLEDERLKRRFKVFLSIMGLLNFSFYFIGEVLRIYNYEEDGGIIIAISDYSMYFIVLISVVFLIIMSSRSFTIQRRTNDETYKSGLRSLSFSFLLIAIAIIIGFSGQIIDLDLFSDIANIITVFLAISGFWFIYLGFVKPARVKKK
jgi:formate hydrogenlyase subunit 3/multisubunit Na+/H+ antiporter MnhD subunit